MSTKKERFVWIGFVNVKTLEVYANRFGYFRDSARFDETPLHAHVGHQETSDDRRWRFTETDQILWTYEEFGENGMRAVESFLKSKRKTVVEKVCCETVMKSIAEKQLIDDYADFFYEGSHGHANCVVRKKGKARSVVSDLHAKLELQLS